MISMTSIDPVSTILPVGDMVDMAIFEKVQSYGKSGIL
jgi:hypothetical protein